MILKVNYKRHNQFFWRSLKVSSIKYDRLADKMIFELADGGLLEVPKWNDCYFKSDKACKEYLASLNNFQENGDQ